MRLTKLSIKITLFCLVISNIFCCATGPNFSSLRNLASSSSNIWESSLTEEQRQEYEAMLELKTSFSGSLSFLPTSFSPEKSNYWTNLNYIIIVFTIIGAFPLGFILFYLVVRFVCKKCRGPEKVSQVTRVYRNVSWVVFGISAVTLITLLSIILGYSSKAK